MGDYQAAIRHLKESLDIFEGLQLGHYAARARGTPLQINCRTPDQVTGGRARSRCAACGSPRSTIRDPCWAEIRGRAQ